MGKVKCLKMDPITDKSGHQMVGMAVSVCTTPAAPSPIPIPYPTVGTVAEGVSDVCMRTKIEGAKVVTVGSLMNKCHGNEPGTLKEVVSLNTAGPCFPALGAPLVISELGMMGITGAIGQMNKSISPGGGGSASGAGGNAGGGGGGGGSAAAPPGQSGQNPSNSGGSGGGSNSGADAPSPGDSSSPSDQHVCQNGHPVDVVSGNVVDRQTDFALPGLIPIELTRFYNSVRRDDVTASLGPGWAHGFEQRVDRDGRLLHLRDEEGRRLTFGHVAVGESTYHRRERMWLHATDDGYRIERMDDRLSYHFRRFEADEGATAWLTRIEDRQGNRVELVYDHGRLAKVIDSVGRVIDFLWSRHGDHFRIDEARVEVDGRRFASVYYHYREKDGCLTSVVDASRHAEGYEYDDKRRMVTATVKNGVSFHYTYDDETHRCVRTWGPDGLYELSFEYDVEARRTVARGEESRVYEWNDKGRMVRETTPDGIVLEERAFDQDNYLIADVDGAGQGTRYWYDELGQLTRVVDADDHETKLEYVYGRPSKRINPDGQVFSFQCDQYGDLTTVRRPSGATFSFTRDRRGRVIAIDGPFGRVAAYSYDQHSNLATETDALGRITTFTYDALGRATSRTDPTGAVTRVRYDALGRRTLVTHPDGTRTQLRYDEMNRVRERIDRDGRKWRYRHEGMGTMTEMIDPSGGRWVFSYTAFERLASITNPSGATYTFERDQAGRLRKETAFDGRSQSYLYDAAGRIEEVQYDDGEARAFAYDVDGRLVEEGTTDGSRTLYQRDVMGRLLRVRFQRDGETLEQIYERDAFGYVVREHQNGHVIEHERDVLGRRVARTLPGGHVTRYRYDAADALVALTHDLDDHTSHRLDFGRDPSGNRRTKAYAARDRREGDAAFNHRFTIDEQVDLEGRLTSQTVRMASPSEGVRAAVTRLYRYDRGGRVDRIDDQRWGTTDFTYDQADRLLTLVRGEHQEAFRVDEGGAIEMALMGLGAPKQKWEAEAGQPVKSVGETRYEHDARGRRVRCVEAEGATTLYHWDGRDRLVGAELPDGTRTRYHYDPHGRRRRKEHLDDEGEVLSAVDFLWDGDVLCADRADGGDWRVFIHHPRSGVPLLQVERGEVFTCVTDQVGIVRELIDRSGEVAWAGAHTAWGALVEEQSAQATQGRSWSPSSPFRLLGQYYDAETGLSCSRYRYFDAATASWCSADPIGIAGGLNLFGFNRAPSLVVDLLGLSDGAPAHGGIIPEGTQHIDDVDFQPAGDKDRVWLGHYGGNGMIIGDQRIAVPMPGKQHLQGQERQFGGRNLSELPGTIEAMRPEIDSCDEIYFNVPEGGIVPGTLTHQEHQHIQSDPDLRDKTTYYTGAVY